MAILDGFDKQKRYITDIDKNHKLVSEWTHSDTVEFADGETLTAKESDIEDRLDAAEESLVHKIGDSGAQTLDGILFVTQGFASSTRDNPRINITGRVIQGYSDEKYEGEDIYKPADMYLNLNGGKVLVGREKNKGKSGSELDVRQVAVYEQEPAQWVYDEWGNQIGNPDTYIPRVMVTSQQKGQIISSRYILQKNVPSDAELTDYKVWQKNTVVDSSYRVLLSETVSDNDHTGSVLKSNKLRFNPNKGDLYLEHNLEVGGGMELGGAEVSYVPYIDFHWNSTISSDYTYRIIQQTSGTLDFLYRNPAQPSQPAAYGDLKAASFIVSSSEHLKKNIKDISADEAKKLLQLRPVSFDYKFGASDQHGLIAEEVMEVLPSMVNIPDGYTEFNPDEPWKAPGIDYSKFVPYLIKMIQVQQAEIDELKSKIN